MSSLNLITFLFISFFSFNANITTLEQEPYEHDQFESDLIQVSANVKRASQSKPFRLIPLNRSLELTANAAHEMFSGGNPLKAEELLEKAIKEYDGNSFAILLLAFHYDTQDLTQKATEHYEKFLKQSRGYTDYERSYIRRHDYDRIRRYVYYLLESRGVDFKGREGDIRTRIPWIYHVMHPDPKDQWMMFGFVAIILIGGLLLIGMKLFGADFSFPLNKALLTFYLGTWISYGLCMFDITLGLPGDLSRFQIVPVFFAGNTLFALSVPILSALRKRFKPPEKGFQKCSRCFEEVPLMILECPNCGNRIES